MAEMLIDGAKLDACNTAEADAIRAKTGGTSPIPYDYANNKGFADAIAAIPSGGGDTLESDFLTVYKETVEAGENTITNSAQYQTYLETIKSIPGTVFAMSTRKKTSYAQNEYGNAMDVKTIATGYRYRGRMWSRKEWNNPQFDANVPVGTLIDIYTVQLKNPDNE